MLKQVTLAKFVFVNKETETSSYYYYNYEATEEPDKVYVFILCHHFIGIRIYSFYVIFKTYSYNYC